MSEFTGERVIPNLVDADLLNEHLARYRFAKRFAASLNRQIQILDAGCGSGYGTAELSDELATVIGTDISAEAIGLARLRYSGGPRFLQAACEALPFAAAAFELVVAFEVIEHLARWQELLTEASRVLKPNGVLLVSTPNRDYYAESRGAAGPNPYHLHEFDYEEFRQALGAVFAHVRIWTQNHAGAIVFAADRTDDAALEVSGSSDPSTAHFYLAACSQSPIDALDVFAWVPTTANVLRERERHIAKLNGELEKKDAWLQQTLDAHSVLQAKHEALLAELERQNGWASQSNLELSGCRVRIVELQGELEARLGWIEALEARIKTADSQIENSRLQVDHAQSQIVAAGIEIDRLNAETLEVREKSTAEIRRLAAESAELRAVISERTAWAQRLDREIEDYRGELQRIGSSSWFRTGATLGIGPRLRGGQ